MVSLKEFFEKDDFEKNQQTTKKHEYFSITIDIKAAYSVTMNIFRKKIFSF